MARQKRGDNWVDVSLISFSSIAWTSLILELSQGLRGIAALIVVTYHLCSCFANWLNSPAIAEKGPASLFQYPILRLVVGGRLAVSLFFVITGYVSSLGARKHIRNGDTDVALSNLSKSTFTRTAKLVAPTNIGVFLAWLVCQLNGYRLASKTDSNWIRGGANTPGPTFGAALNGLFRNLVLFWHSGGSEYDHTYWTIPFFLKGSMLVYLTILATTFTRPISTKIILVFLYLFAWSGGQALMEMNIYAGMFLAELNSDFGSRATSLIPAPISALMIFIGLFLASFPDEHPEWMLWSRTVNTLASPFIPNGGELNRYVISVGTIISVAGVFFSPHARRFLTTPAMNFLGKVSFPIYLLHNTLIRTVLCFFLYRNSVLAQGLHPVNAKGEPAWLERGGPLTFVITITIFYTTLLYTAHLWTIHVDPRCERAVSWLSSKAFGENNSPDLGEMEPLDGILKGMNEETGPANGMDLR
ncbi:hypothetical protein N7462_001690 [Penicillium macrosclerotiorum]|uniref:uncharacterized protein n=1 Tax=Penicillium macrosclerotiorum TaxID=303699 RepID=UPI00254806BE|nr:uncharacterized protein N7462_001690 [Penicillium macrosclerotiorum]KAJ5692267.1 hypothetical protein N7462_001690 [Penicillium macrosclerotiorum]